MAVTITETATSVVVSFSGSLNTAASTPGTPTNCPVDDGFLGAEDSCVGPGGAVLPVDQYNIAGPNNLGLGPGSTPPDVADSSVGANQFGISINNPADPLTFRAVVDVGYLSGTVISGSSTFTGASLASLNIGNTGLVGTWTLLDGFGGTALTGVGSSITLTVYVQILAFTDAKSKM